jgi:hypothetical protein
MNPEKFDWQRLNGLGFDLDYLEKATKGLKDSCWEGYTAVGMKKGKGGKKVPNCVKVDSKHSENPVDSMVPGALPKLEGKKSPKERFLTEAGYSEESEDRFKSVEPNGEMVLTQLKVMQEKLNFLLSAVKSDDNFEPWVSTKIANAGVAVASVSDYLRFGGET